MATIESLDNEDVFDASAFAFGMSDKEFDEYARVHGIWYPELGDEPCSTN